MPFERAVVYGAGAVGSYLGARLSSVLPVTLIARADHATAIEKRGLAVAGQINILAPPQAIHAATSLASIEPATLVMVAVKLRALEDAGRALANLARPDTLFLLVQNGLYGQDIFARGAGRPLETARAIVSCGVDFRAPGEVDFWGGGLSLEASRHSRRLIELFELAGVEATESSDFGRALWMKLAVNCVANPLTALLGVRNLDIVCPELAAVRLAIIGEVSSVAAAEGHPLPTELAERVDQAISGSHNRSSMLQDIERGRPTEIEHLNGFIERRAAELGLPAPTNAVLAALIRARSTSNLRFAAT